jgi:glucosamine--fructose-6-phosphate aminotransferase (isomerizing)
VTAVGTREAVTSAMRATMWRQPEELRRLLADGDAAARAAERLAARRVLLAGTGTSWHAANHGAWMLRAAGVEAWAIQPLDAAIGGVAPGEGDALVLLSHTGVKRYSAQLREAARMAGVPTLAVGGIDQPGVDLPTVARERSAAYTASHLGALLRLAQLATALGADLGPLDGVPDAVANELERPSRDVVPPARLPEYTGAGTNAWTAEEDRRRPADRARGSRDARHRPGRVRLRRAGSRCGLGAAHAVSATSPSARRQPEK